MVLQVGVEIVDQQLLLQLLLHVGDDAEVEVHPEGRHLPGLPVLPQPPRDVEKDSLKYRECRTLSHLGELLANVSMSNIEP